MEVAYSDVLHGSIGQLRLGSPILPINRLETRNWDLLAALPALAGRNPLVLAREKVRELTRRKHVFFAPSGRAAITQVLSLLPHTEVVMPAYTCSAVKVAVQLAGKKMIFTDLAPGSVNCTSVEFERHMRPGRVVLATHLFGIPTDIERICALAKQRECVTIEDAAASVGARCGSGLLGTFGDVGIYSFERSKRFPAFRGAAIVLNNEGTIDPGQLTEAEMSSVGHAVPFREIVSSIVYNLTRLPAAYQRIVVPRQLKMYSTWKPGAGEKSLQAASDSEFFRGGFHPYQAALLFRMLRRIDQIRDHIGKLVSVYIKELRGSPVMTFLPDERDDTAILRMPVAIPGARRSDVLRLALERGLFLETNYERLLTDSGSEERFPNAQWAADNVLLLPLYTLLSEQNAKRIAQQLVSISQGR
jgi:perosamine synthetase